MDFQGALAVGCANFLLCALDLELKQFVGIDFIVDHDLSRDNVIDHASRVNITKFKLHNDYVIDLGRCEVLSADTLLVQNSDLRDLADRQRKL
jgi:hypothetical protein